MDLIGRNTVIWGLLILCVLGPSTAHAGSRIILHDGTVEESDRVWESDKYVHFILRGTQTVEIRYAKEIVARIEPMAPRHEIAGSPAKAVIPELSQDAIAPGSSQTADKTSPLEEVPSDPAAPPSRPAPDPKIIASHRNVSFYDPQRTQRYWASHQSRHASLSAALEALAKLYDRPTDWVVAHMGQENDLGRIHANLIAAANGEGDTDSQAASEIPPPGDAGPVSSAVTATGADAEYRPMISHPPVDSTWKVPFYDPRRTKKYWSTPSHGHNTPYDAIQHLAESYGVSADWIERHMGQENDLAVIHHNIQAGLRQSP